QRLVRVPSEASVRVVDTVVAGPHEPCDPAAGWPDPAERAALDGLVAWEGLRVDDVAGDVGEFVPVGHVSALAAGGLVERLRAAAGDAWTGCRLVGRVVGVPGEGSHVLWLVRRADKQPFDRHHVALADRGLKSLARAL